MVDLTFKRINPATRIGVSNLKYEIEKAKIAKFDKNLKDLPDNMYSNYNITTDKGERHYNYVCHILRALL